MSKLRSLSSFLFIFILFSISFIVGCGSGNQVNPPAKAGFTNASLKGAYAFSISGTDAGGFFSFLGSIQADGNGTITAGTVDLNSRTLASPVNTSATGTYNVLSDGRTTVNLNTPAGSFSMDIDLLSTSNGVLIRFDNNGTASGSINLQNATAFSDAALAGSFAFSLAGVDGGGNPDLTAGSFTFNSSGTITAGIQDLNDNGAVTANAAISGSVANPTNGRGTITLNTNQGVLDFAFYVIDANHISILSTNSSPAFSGDAFRQPATITLASAFPAGSSAFTLAGTSNNSPLVAGGILTTNGNGTVSAGTEDVNTAGTLNQNVAVSGSYTIASTGRGTLTLNSNQNFAIYPTMTGGTLMLDLGAIDTGSAFAQTGGPFSNGTLNGSFGLNFTGDNLNEAAELDGIAQFSANGNGSLNGALDLNNAGSLSTSAALSGNYSIAANGRGTGSFSFPGETNLGLSNLNVIYYVISSSRALFIEADGIQPSAGVIVQQQQ
jgi:hypothetical protein